MKFRIYFAVLLVWLLGACTGKNFSLETDYFSIRINDTGQIIELRDKATATDYKDKSNSTYLLSVGLNGQLYHPTSLLLSEGEKSMIVKFADIGTEAKIRYNENESYLTFELVDLITEDSVEFVVWGPFHTTIGETIGETVGVVRNPSFAIGIQALNLKTLGGYPTHADDTEPAYDIFASNSLVDVSDSVKVLYRGQTARRTDTGSVLQAYTRNRDRERIIEVWGHPHYIVPAYNDGGVIGSKLALFGCPASLALDIIGKIEIAEGLPHPMLNGEWIKTNPEATSSYLILSFAESNFEEALKITKEAGLRYLYHSDPFENWGHFKLKPTEFPDNWATLSKLVKRAREEGIHLGVHTLSNFITTNDPYVTPVPHENLAKIGYTALADDVGPQERNLPITDTMFFSHQGGNNLHCIQIGSEIIRYERVSDLPPWQLINCERGAWGTKPTGHQKNSKVYRLMDHGYKVFLANTELSKEIAEKLADLCNETGIRQISFDGLEGNWASGMGQYGRHIFVKTWYDRLKPELKGEVINDASNPGHFYWHFATRMNWGEPWYAGFRESQTKYRLMNQDYFDRNLMPNMLGWFSLSSQTSLMDTEWLLARAVAFDAGFGLATSLRAIKENGIAKEILRKIRIWEEARLAGVFPNEIKEKMKDIEREFSLEKIDSLHWELKEAHSASFEIVLNEKQPGEPLYSSIDFQNPFDEQPLQFVAQVKKGGKISDIEFELNNFIRIPIPLRMEETDILMFDGGDAVILYDQQWNEKNRFPVDRSKLIIRNGKLDLKINANGTTGTAIKLELRTLSPPQTIKQ